MIKIENLTKSFGEQIVLDGLNLQIGEGEIVAVLGESGVGKSVLLKHMMGLLKPDSGRVVVDGVDFTALPENQLLRKRSRIGYLFQEGALYDFMNVYENLAFPLKEHTKLSRDAINQKVVDTLLMVDLPGIELKFPSELSGGMKKRVGLARAIILDSKIILCDEPTSGLDPIRSRDISDKIQSIARRLGCTVVITSHDIKNTLRIADRIVLIQKGKIVAQGTPQELVQSNHPFVKEFLN